MYSSVEEEIGEDQGKKAYEEKDKHGCDNEPGARVKTDATATNTKAGIIRLTGRTFPGDVGTGRRPKSIRGWDLA